MYLSPVADKSNEESKFFIGGYNEFYMGDPQFTYTNLISDLGYYINL